MSNFLLELRCEEIPARMQVKASEDLARLFAEELAKAGLKAEAIESFVTPRRLALIARDLPLQTEAVSEEHKGPRTSAPPQALEGFLRKTGLRQDQLEDRDGIWFAVVNKPGRATADVLAAAIPAIVRSFPWPKSMRWGTASQTTESLRWVRPLQGIIALLGNDLVDIEIDGIRSGYTTVGHRFHSSGDITIGNADDYAVKLRAAHVIVSHQERQAIIAEKAAQAAAAKGYTVIEDKGLVAENAGLTEWPVPLLGDFDPAFLEVPPEVIQLTLRINQKYFVLRDGQGKLAPAFICTANIEAKDGGEAIVAGNRKVLAARLSDARFFWEQDKKTKLEVHAEKLSRITFHEKLGTVADKVERVAKLARWLVEEGIILPGTGRGTGEAGGGGAPLDATSPDAVPGANPLHHPAGGPPPRAGEELAQLAYDAAKLCKADLVTEMVGEFPELQGIMGGYYARAEGLPDAVADAIRDHYKPVGQGDDVPTAPITVAVSLADKLDTLFSFFDIREFPTGSKDPFALRRAALASIRIILDNHLLIHTDAVIEFWLGQAGEYAELSTRDVDRRSLLGAVLDFLLDRLSVQLREKGVRHDFVEASRRWDARDDGRLDRVTARALSLQSFIGTEDGANLLAGYRRAANILKKEAPDLSSRHPGLEPGSRSSSASPSDGAEGSETPDQVRGDEHGPTLPYTPEPAEAALIGALDAAEPLATAAIAREDFEGAMAALASLRGPIDAFFEGVTVNDADPEKRAARLALLARVRAAVHQVADFSRIEG